MPESSLVLIIGDHAPTRLREAFRRRGHRATVAPLSEAVEAVSPEVEAVVVSARPEDAVTVARRLKTRFQMPLLPVVALVARRPRAREQTAPDVWLPTSTRPSDIVERVEELVRIRRAEGELVRLSNALAELAAENGRLYERARRDAEATTLLMRELQHRVRNNLASIQALLVLERHRAPPRALSEALDVAIGRLQSMAALQSSLVPQADSVELSTLARAVSRSALEVFGAVGHVCCDVSGSGTLPARSASAAAIVLNELITNALKHARASSVRVEISDHDRELELDVIDDGIGLTPAPTGGSGLMIARAVVRNELGGTLSFLEPARGTHVRIRIPRLERRVGEARDR